jgi:hypothetical protein
VVKPTVDVTWSDTISDLRLPDLADPWAEHRSRP